MSSRLSPTARSSFKFQPELTTAARQFRADLAALQAFHFELQAAVLRLLHHHAAHAGDLLQALLHFAGIGSAVGRFDFERHRLGAAQPVREVRDRILRHQLALADDDDALAGVLDLGQDVGAEDDGVLAGQLPSSSRISMICLGSRPLVGSSRIRTSGLWMIAWAMPDALPVALGELADQLVADIAERRSVRSLRRRGA